MNPFSNDYPSTGYKQPLRHATAEEVRKAFIEQPEELNWLAFFLTCDKELARVCILDACALATTANDVLVHRLDQWTRCCTIVSAVEMQQQRITQLAAVHERTRCFHAAHAPLVPVALELLYDNAEELSLEIDTLCRATLILLGIERYSLNESALMLGVSQTAVEAAYCAALESIEILSCEALLETVIAAQPCC